MKTGSMCKPFLILSMLASLLSACGSEELAKNEPTGTAQNTKLATWLEEISSIPVANRDTRPLHRYEELLPAAKAGDRDAQYELAQVYRFCAATPGYFLLTYLKLRGMPEGTASMLEQNQALCKDFDGAFEDWDQPSHPKTHWASAALSQAHPIALAEESLRSYRLWESASKRAAQSDQQPPAPVPAPSEHDIYLALAHGADHPELMGYAVTQGYRFFRAFRADDYMARQGYDPASGRHKRGPLREAWSILACYHLVSCSVESHLHGMSQRYSHSEMDETVQTVLTLYEAIVLGDWEKLGLSEIV